MTEGAAQDRSARERTAIRSPDDRPLAGFPRGRLTRRRTLRRGHQTANGPWWFASSGGGRFDLTEPEGTCYLAYDMPTAIRETVGERLSSAGVIDYEFAVRRCVSALHVPRSHAVADTCHPRAADFGITRELFTLTPYELPQQWARALRAAGHEGLRYQTRFTTTSRANAVALFGPAGEAPWATDPRPEGFASAAIECGFRVVARPRAVRIVAPPERPAPT